MNCVHFSFVIAAVGVCPVCGVLFYTAYRARLKALNRFAAPELVPSLVASFSPFKWWLSRILWTLGVSCLLLALSRPQWGHRFEEVRGRGLEVIFALDASKSMLAQDIKPNRLERSKMAIWDLAQQLKGNRLGLIVFAGSAFVECPVTPDWHAFRQCLDAVGTDMLSSSGTDLAAALKEAQAAFSQGNAFKCLVLITDGEDLAQNALDQAKKAAQEGITVHTVGVGSVSGELIPVATAQGGIDYLRDEEGKLVKTRLDETTLQKIAQLTQGIYAPLGVQGEGLMRIYQEALEKLPKQELESQWEKIPLERFQWPLAVGFVLFLLEPWVGNRRRTIAKIGVAQPHPKK